MKKILLIICLFPILVFSQKSYKIPADSTILNNIGSGKNELVIRNATSNITGGVLTNLGNGVTAFVLGGGSARVVDTIYKNNTKDSIVFTISGIRYAVKDSFNLNTDSQTLSISNDTLTISGGNNVVLPFIPLSGTEVDKPVTNTVVTQSDYNTIVSTQNAMNIGIGDDLNLVDNANQKSQVVFGKDSELMAFSAIEAVFDNNAGRSATLQLISDTSTANLILSIGYGVNDSRGIIGSRDFSPNITSLDYTQKIYVDQRISDTATQIRSEIPNVSNFATITNLADTSALLRGLIPQTLTFSTGLTNTSSTITNNLSTGVSGGQSVIGGTASGENLTLSSTSNATKGDLRFGTSVYKEVNNRLGIGTTAPGYPLEIVGNNGGFSISADGRILSTAANTLAFTAATFASGLSSIVHFGASVVSPNTAIISCNGQNTFYYALDGKMGIGNAISVPKASLHIQAGTATANTAPIKLTAGTKLATPETGTLEFVTGRFVIQSDAITMGTSAGDPSSLIDIQSTTKGFLPPRMTTTQRDAISSPATGLTLFCTDCTATDASTGVMQTYNGATWKNFW